MDPQQIARRQAAADRHDAALAQWPHRSGPQFTAIMYSVIAELSQLSDELARSQAITLDRAITLRWLGAAYFDLARSEDEDLLEQSLDAYTGGEVLVEHLDDAAERARLHFNTAKTLQALARGTNRPLLEEARRRLQLAADFFRETDHQRLPLAERALTIVDMQLTALGPLEDASGITETTMNLEMPRQGVFAATVDFDKPMPPSGSRAETLFARLTRLNTFLIGEMTHALESSAEKQRVRDLFARETAAEGQVLDVGRDELKTSALERDVLRPLALDAHLHALRHHMMLVDPVWPSASMARDPGAVFFSGGAEHSLLTQKICKARGLRLKSVGPGRILEQARWDDLRASNVGIFDLTVPEGPQLAAVCLELGVSRVLGMRCVIIAFDDKPLPFDVDVQAIALPDVHGCKVLGEALDKAVYGVARLEGQSAVPATLEYAQQWFAQGRRPEVKLMLRELDDVGDDAFEARSRLEHLIGFAGPGNVMLTLPAWPARYPREGAKRCFHVMPHTPRWVEGVTAAAVEACEATATQYVRGDRGTDQHVIRSSWDEICRATHVLVDLTGWDPGVALELGIALTLGKRMLVMAHDDAVVDLPPVLRKMRVATYNPGHSAGISSLITEKLLSH